MGGMTESRGVQRNGTHAHEVHAREAHAHEAQVRVTLPIRNLRQLRPV
jgi:hypothetical protein